MAVLFNQTKNKKISSNLNIANTLWSRTKGLLGKNELKSAEEMLWILRCNSIHTFFMKFPIDCVFLNKQLVVCGLRENVLPWRIILPLLNANSVIEMEAGKIISMNIQVGDQLNVGS